MGLTRAALTALLAEAATRSQDPDTRTAAIVLRPPSDRPVLSAANCLARGVMAHSERLARPAKYTWVMHAEAQLVALAARYRLSLSGSTVFLNWYPCAPCASLLVEAGVGTLVADRDRYGERLGDTRYGFAEAAAILAEGGVDVRWLQEWGG